NGRTKAWLLQLVLFVSLAINLFVAGYFVARLWEHHRPDGPPGPMMLAERLAAPLNEKDRELLLSAWKANQPKLAGLNAELQAARRNVRAKLTAEPFDRAALAAAMAEARAKHLTVDEAIQSVILDAVVNFSPEGRKLLWSKPLLPPPPH
ncbi:MAG: periplasmic heavy metal sensor, partial [Alphaproteobacteria bacterium]